MILHATHIIRSVLVVGRMRKWVHMIIIHWLRPLTQQNHGNIMFLRLTNANPQNVFQDIWTAFLWATLQVAKGVADGRWGWKEGFLCDFQNYWELERFWAWTGNGSKRPNRPRRDRSDQWWIRIQIQAVNTDRHLQSGSSSIQLFVWTDNNLYCLNQMQSFSCLVYIHKIYIYLYL